MKRASIRVQEPTPELIEKIRRARVAGSNEALVQDDLITLQSQCARNTKFRDLVLSVGIGSDTADASIRRETGE